MARRFLFAGPSLPDAEVLVRGHDIQVLPPVAAGDLLRLKPAPADMVGIVDGYFHSARAIPHKEIMQLLAAGTTVLGASSMGALRAAELGPWGMRGVGRIHAAYTDGALVADDEVVLLHGPAEDGYRHLSEPLVNMRATLDAAVVAGVCSPDVRDALVGWLAAGPYRDRTYRRLVTQAAALGLDSLAVKQLDAFCTGNAVDLKRSDAVELLALMASDPDPTVLPCPPPHQTIYLRDWSLELDADALTTMRIAQVLAPDFVSFHREFVLAELREECRRDCGQADPDPIRHGAHRGWYADDAADSGVEFLHAWTTPQERTAEPPAELLLRFLVRSYRIKPGVAPTERELAAFKAHPAWSPADELRVRIETINDMARDHRADFAAADMAADIVVGWLRERWGGPGEALELAAFDRGFGDTGVLLAAARMVFLAAQCDPVTRTFTLGHGADPIGTR